MRLRSGKVISRENHSERMASTPIRSSSTTASIGNSTAGVTSTNAERIISTSLNNNQNDPTQAMTTAMGQNSSFGNPFTSATTLNTTSAPLWGMPPGWNNNAQGTQTSPVFATRITTHQQGPQAN